MDRREKMRKVALFCILFAAVSLGQPCYGENSYAGKQSEELNRLRKQVGTQGKQLEEQQRQIDELKSQVGTDPESLDIRGGQGEAAQPGKQPPAAEPARKKKKATGKQTIQSQADTPTQPVGQPPEKKPTRKQYEEIEAIFRQQGVLTPQNTLIIEPSFQYAYSSSTRVVVNGYTILPAIAIGLIDVRSVNRNTYIPALSLRYGITSRFEINTYAPYVFRSDSYAIPIEISGSVIPEQRSFDVSGNDIGDVQFGLRYQLNMPTTSCPIFIAGLLAKAPTGRDPFHVATTDFAGQQVESQLATGTGFWAIQPSLSAIVPSDPVVFFGSVNYLYNFSSNKPVTTQNPDGSFTTENVKVEPGNTFGFNFGMGFSMNEKTSFSIGWEQYIIAKTKVAGSYPPGSQSTTLGSLLFGASYKLSDTVSLNFSLEAGITEAAPDVQLTLRVPFSI
jgi:hypothetical protein